mmetsp:Transcript_81202/g.217010  ORF Transcript_81202/g.217010 Transcript_81202/m.217010 type:complete len:251 (+) Transcript_81202:99-851(+)
MAGLEPATNAPATSPADHPAGRMPSLSAAMHSLALVPHLVPGIQALRHLLAEENPMLRGELDSSLLGLWELCPTALLISAESPNHLQEIHLRICLVGARKLREILLDQESDQSSLRLVCFVQGLLILRDGGLRGQACGLAAGHVILLGLAQPLASRPKPRLALQRTIELLLINSARIAGLATPIQGDPHPHHLHKMTLRLCRHPQCAIGLGELEPAYAHHLHIEELRRAQQLAEDWGLIADFLGQILGGD